MGCDRVVCGCLRAGRRALADPLPLPRAQPASTDRRRPEHRAQPRPPYVREHPSHRSGAPTLARALWPAHRRGRTFGYAHTLLRCAFAHAQPAAHAHAIARTAAPLARAHVHAHAISHFSLHHFFFFFFSPPDGSCRVGGPAALGGKFPGRGRYYQLPGAHLAFRREAIGGGCPTPKAARGATQSPEAPRK